MIVETLQVGKAKRATIALALAGVLCAVAAASPAAVHAQAVCDEYSIGPLCRGGDRGGDGGSTDSGGPFAESDLPVGSEAEALTSELEQEDARNPQRAITAAKGEIPVAGYPATPIVILLAVLLGGGLLIRTYLAVRDRRHARPGGGPFNSN